MNRSDKAAQIVRDLERITPYVFEGLYGNFLSVFMTADKSRWTRDLSNHLSNRDQDWSEVGDEIATLLWERFEKRISC